MSPDAWNKTDTIPFYQIGMYVGCQESPTSKIISLTLFELPDKLPQYKHDKQDDHNYGGEEDGYNCSDVTVTYFEQKILKYKHTVKPLI